MADFRHEEETSALRDDDFRAGLHLDFTPEKLMRFIGTPQERLALAMA